MEATTESPILYDDARQHIRSGDLLLWRHTRKPHSRLISWWSRSQYSHAAMAAWFGGPRIGTFDTEAILMNAEVLEWNGGRLVTLSSQVTQWPGLCDVYHVNADGYCGERAALAIARRAGQPYGWRDLGYVGLNRILPFMHEEITDDTPVVCSDAVAEAACKGFGSVPDDFPLAPGCRPGDLAQPVCVEYRFTLYATPAQVWQAQRRIHAAKPEPWIDAGIHTDQPISIPISSGKDFPCEDSQPLRA